ncbi:phosphate signaling complex protein PhoU [Planctobacterium marinum]|uniref:Phosphate-specific transport system accessory protein PhoU n=1 Tax=Planctobacterium marinum TaxID=1631968 RepID=A0AA48HE62_9ALTE|nr:phosphate transport system regulatory protein PhoU [Planctobacterium marinum]
MQSFNMTSHISGKFNEELESLKNAVLAMGGEVELYLNRTLTALKTNDRRAAEKVVLGDATVNNMELRIDEECMRIIARRHPAASDLRLVLTVVKINVDVERIGDEVERIARMVANGQIPVSERIKADMFDIGHLILEMFQNTLNAFARMDDTAAEAVHAQDQRVDEQYKQLLIEVIQEMQKKDEIDPAWLEVLWSLRSMERIGDRCKNICEYVIYFVRGVNLRHK